MRFNTTQIVTGLVALFLIAGLAAWANQRDRSNNLESISYRASFFLDGHQAGLIAAQEKGFFAKEGLEVNLQPGGSINADAKKLVAAGAETIGEAGGYDEILIAREKQLPIKAFAVIQQKNPTALLVNAKHGYKEPKDIEGKKISFVPGGSEEILYRSLMKKLNLKEGEVVPFNFNFSLLVSDQVAAIAGFRTAGPQFIKAAGGEASIIRFEDYGINSYGYTLFASEKTIEQKPAMLRRFVRAAEKGWNYAFAHPEEVAQLVVQRNSNLKVEDETAKIKAIQALIYPNKTAKFGEISETKLAEIAQRLAEYGQISRTDLAKGSYVSLEK